MRAVSTLRFSYKIMRVMMARYCACFTTRREFYRLYSMACSRVLSDKYGIEFRRIDVYRRCNRINGLESVECLRVLGDKRGIDVEESKLTGVVIG